MTEPRVAPCDQNPPVGRVLNIKGPQVVLDELTDRKQNCYSGEKGEDFHDRCVRIFKCLYIQTDNVTSLIKGNYFEIAKNKTPLLEICYFNSKIKKIGQLSQSSRKTGGLYIVVYATSYIYTLSCAGNDFYGIYKLKIRYM